ncbi:hypothetical protein DXG01_016953 [Tephrocybe rancida]|nr:hypothetical protein DXG01_016953 [Tephrocybe rancida]
MDINISPENLPAFYPLTGRKLRSHTTQLHGGTPCKDPATNAKTIPIYPSAAFVFDSSAHSDALFDISSNGQANMYSRIGNPTVDAFEKRAAALEGGAHAIGVGSGQAAQFLALTTLARSGENIVASSLLYGGTHHQMSVLFERYGILVKFADGNDPVSMESLIDDKTRAVYCETISNPRYNVPDMPVIAEVAHRHGLPLVVDNTFGACGFIARPFEMGADIVVESATKWIGGHGTTLGGVIIDSGKFDWSKSTRFPAFNTVIQSTESRAGIDALVGHTFYEVLKDRAFTTQARFEILRDVGACLSPQAAWLLIQGLETLSLRIERHLSNAMAVAKYLDAHPKVAWVLYPGLPSHPDHEIAKRLLKGKFGCVLSFGVKGGRGRKLVDKLKLHSHLANLGDVHSLIIHPASTTHGQLTEAARQAAGVTQDMLRVSVGTEHIDDIIEDYEIAFSQLDVGTDAETAAGSGQGA